MGRRWRIRPRRTFSPVRRRGRLRQPAPPSGCTSSSGRSSSDLQRWSLSPTVISEASSRFLIRSPTTRQAPPSIQGRQAGPPGRHHARLPSSRITPGTPDDPDDRRDEKQGGRGARAAGVQQQAPAGLIRPARASASPQARVRARRRAYAAGALLAAFPAPTQSGVGVQGVSRDDRPSSLTRTISRPVDPLTAQVADQCSDRLVLRRLSRSVGSAAARKAWAIARPTPPRIPSPRPPGVARRSSVFLNRGLVFEHAPTPLRERSDGRRLVVRRGATRAP